jgi:hypothetical protein
LRTYVAARHRNAGLTPEDRFCGRSGERPGKLGTAVVPPKAASGPLAVVDHDDHPGEVATSDLHVLADLGLAERLRPRRL